MASKKGRILFVEDNEIDRMAFERFALKNDFPYDYVLARSVKEASDILERDNFDALVTDYSLGEDTAFDLFDKIKGAPIIVVTSIGDETIAVEAIKKGAYDYLVKSTEGTHLKTLPVTIEKAIRRKKDEEELIRYRHELEELVEQRTAELRKEIDERMKVEEKLVMFREFAEASGQGLGWANIEGDIVYFNPALCCITGEEGLEDFIGKSFMEYYDEETQKRLAEDILPIVVREGQWTGELDLLNAKGEIIPTINNIFVIRNEEGEPICFCNVLSDITERKRVEEAFRESEEKLRTLVELVPNAVYECDIDGRIIIANSSYERITGYSKGELIGMHVGDLMEPGPQKDSLPVYFTQLIKEQPEPTAYICKNLTKDGRVIDVQVDWTYKMDEKGRVIGFVCILADITERKRVEEKIREKTYLTQTLLDNMPCIALLIRPYKREIVACNEAALNVNAVVGKQCFATWGQSDEPCPWCLADEVWETGGSRQVEVEIENTFWDTYWVPITQDLYLHYAFDITERKRAEEDIRLLAKYPEENPNPVLRIKNDGTVEFANQASGPILEAFNCKLGMYRHGACLPDDWSRQIKEIYESQKSKEVELGHKGRIFSITITPFTDTNYLYCYGRDVTEQKQAEDELYKHREHLQDLVQERTAELTNSNVQLMQEINVRKQTEYKLRQRRKELQSLASELSLAEEKERRRIAVGLHDDIGQTLYITKMKLEALQGQPADLDKSLRELIGNIEQAIQSTRSLTFELCSPILYELGFEAALRSLTEQMYQQHGIDISFEEEKLPDPPDSDISVLIYQSVRELLANVTKHAQARSVKVSVKKERENIRINIYDDGVGFDPSRISGKGGFGLFSIRERLAYLGGYLELESEPGRGTHVSLVTPLKSKKDQT